MAKCELHDKVESIKCHIIFYGQELQIMPISVALLPMLPLALPTRHDYPPSCLGK